MTNPLDEDLLGILCCPSCRGEVVLQDGGGGLLCRGCRLLYPIREGIPIMLVEEAGRFEADAAAAGDTPASGEED